MTDKEIQEAAIKFNCPTKDKYIFIAGAKWMQEQENWIEYNGVFNTLPNNHKMAFFISDGKNILANNKNIGGLWALHDALNLIRNGTATHWSYVKIPTPPKEREEK